MKHAIIIGGTKGVGRELAGLFAATGQHVTAVGRNPGEFPQVTGGAIEGFPGSAEGRSRCSPRCASRSRSAAGCPASCSSSAIAATATRGPGNSQSR